MFLSTKSLNVIIKIFVLSYLVPIIAYLITTPLDINKEELLIIALLYTLEVCVYFFGVFVIVHSSLHIHILLRIAGLQSAGLRLQELEKIFSEDIILRKRIDQLVELGEITIVKNYYKRVNKVSFLKFRDKLTLIIEKLFP